MSAHSSIFLGSDRSAVNGARVTSCSADFGQKGDWGIVKTTVSRVGTVGFHKKWRLRGDINLLPRF